MRLKSAASFAVGFLFVSFWLHGDARCQSSVARPLSIAPPPSVTDQGSPTAATCHWGGLNLCSNPASPGVLSPRPTAKGSPPPAPEVPMYPPPVILASPPTATDDVPPRTATAKGSARSAAAKNSPPPANDKDAPAPAVDKHFALAGHRQPFAHAAHRQAVSVTGARSRWLYRRYRRRRGDRPASAH